MSAACYFFRSLLPPVAWGLIYPSPPSRVLVKLSWSSKDYTLVFYGENNTSWGCTAVNCLVLGIKFAAPCLLLFPPKKHEHYSARPPLHYVDGASEEMYYWMYAWYLNLYEASRASHFRRCDTSPMIFLPSISFPFKNPYKIHNFWAKV